MFFLVFILLDIFQDYRQSHPEVTVLDPPDAIQHLRNRQYMLQAVADMNLCDSYGIFFVSTLIMNCGYMELLFSDALCSAMLSY